MNLLESSGQVSLIAAARCRSKTAVPVEDLLVPVEDLGCAWSLRPHKLFLVAVADEDDLQAFTELYKLTVGNLRQLLGWRKVGAPKGGRRPMSPERCRQLAAALQAPRAHHQRECATASRRQRGIMPLVGNLPHQQAAERIPNPNPNPNPGPSPGSSPRP